MLLQKNAMALSLRAGLGAYSFKDFTNSFNPNIILPLMVNGYYGKNHKLRVGIGQSVTKITGVNQNDYQPISKINAHTIFCIGYHYQRVTKGLIGGVAYTPVFMFNQFYKNRIGVTLGYAF